LLLRRSNVWHAPSICAGTSRFEIFRGSGRRYIAHVSRAVACRCVYRLARRHGEMSKVPARPVSREKPPARFWAADRRRGRHDRWRRLGPQWLHSRPRETRIERLRLRAAGDPIQSWDVCRHPWSRHMRAVPAASAPPFSASKLTALSQAPLEAARVGLEFWWKRVHINVLFARRHPRFPVSDLLSSPRPSPGVALPNCPRTHRGSAKLPRSVTTRRKRT
jgi:hypothetical protein